MLLIGFYFTPSVVGRSIIAALIIVKYWFFLFWIKTEEESEVAPIQREEISNE
ncbi:putative transmembrane protein [Rodentibacter pneumotropicus]|nr:putative transmembrane protein [Rodentibacter pneumotropicus]